MKIKIYLISSLLLLIPTVIILQASFLDKRYGVREPVPECPWCEYSKRPDVVYIPVRPSIMRLFAPADLNFLADVLWLRTIYYFGQHVLTDREYPYLLHLLDLITDISPRWILPYIFGAIVLPSETESVDDGFYIIDKGIQHHPNNWQLWFYKGFYLWEFRKDHLAAAQAIYKASSMPKAPLFLVPLASTFATQAGSKELGFHFIQEALKNIKDPLQRRILLQKMEKMGYARDGSSME